MLFNGGKIIHNIIEGNNVIDPDGYQIGGGISALVYNNHTAIIRNNIIRSNTGSGLSVGGGIHLEGGRIIVEDNRIENNTLTGSEFGLGGGLFFNPYNGDGAIQEMIMRNNLVTGNRATGASPEGGGEIFIAYSYKVGSLTISNNIISNNYSSGSGGGVNLSGLARLNFFNNTVLNNKSELNANTMYMGGYSRNIIVMNNILWSDENPDSSGIIVRDRPESAYVYGNILDNEIPPLDGVVSKYNIVADPLVDTVSYALAAGSLAVGHGLDSVKINDTWYYAPPTDMAGNPRPYPVDSYVDLGAKESPFARNIVYIPAEKQVITGFRIYPNPAYDLLTIETEQSGPCAIEITSMNGQILYSTIMKGSTHQIDLSPFQKGIYFITLRSRDYVRTEEIIKL